MTQVNIEPVNAELVSAAERVSLKYGHDDDGTPSDWTEWKDLREAISRAQAAPVVGALHVGDSSFEDWYQSYPRQGSSKQVARDAYAAGMGDPLVATHPQATEPAPSTEVLQALTDPENQPNQFGVVFGMRGPRMFFTIGNQSFDLAYEPDSTEEFEFMKRMLCSAFSTFTPDVKTAPAPSTAGEREEVIELLKQGAAISRDRGINLDFAKIADRAAALLSAPALPAAAMPLAKPPGRPGWRPG